MARTRRTKGILACALLGPCLVYVLIMGGCARYATAWLPGPVKIQGAHTFFLIAGEGLEKDRQIIYDALSKQLSENYFFSVVDGTRSGVYLDFHENGVWVRNEKSALNRSEMYLQIDIVDWRIKTKPAASDGKSGSQYLGVVGLTMTLINRDGDIVLDEKPYVAQAIATETAEVETIRAKAAVQAISQFVKEITPTPVKRKVFWDESDSSLDDILTMAQEGNLTQASRLLRQRWHKDYRNQAVIYNFALVRDLLGDTQEALFLLEGLPMNYRMQDIHAYKIKLKTRLDADKQRK